MEARCTSVEERPLMVRRVIGSIPHGGLIELFLANVLAAVDFLSRYLNVLSVSLNVTFSSFFFQGESWDHTQLIGRSAVSLHQ